MDPTVEYPDGFDEAHNIRFMNVTKWIVDPKEDSLEKLVNVYDVLADEDCNIALVFNRTSSTTNVYLAVVDVNNTEDNIDVDNFTKRIADAIKGNFPGSEIGAAQRGTIPCLQERHAFSVAAVSNVPTEKNDRFTVQTIEKVLDGIVPSNRGEDYTIVLLATPIHDVAECKLRLAELHSMLTPYASWTTNYTYHRNDSIGSSATIGVNAGVSAGTQNGTSQAVGQNYNETDSSNESTSQSESQGTSDSSSSSESVTDTDSNGTNKSSGGVISGGLGVPKVAQFGISANHSQGSSHSTSTAKGTTDIVGRAVSKSLGKAVTSGIGKAVSKGASVTSGVSKSVNLGANFGGSFARSSTVTATLGTDEGITQTFKNFSIQHALEILESQMK